MKTMPPNRLDPSSPLALAVHQLMVNFDTVTALWDITLSVPSGLLVAIVGPNGAGKSTFIKAALGLISPVLSGNFSFFETSLDNVRQRVAYMPQRESVDWDFPITVRDLVVMGRYGKLGLCRHPRKEDWEIVDDYLEKVGMTNYAHRQISQLSGGQQQRVFLARALAQEADLYFMDEPFTGIDMATEVVMIELLQQLRSKGKTVFVVHHDLNTVEKYFDWVILLNMRLIACGPISTYFTPSYLQATYGKNYALFDQALKLSQQKQTGYISP